VSDAPTILCIPHAKDLVRGGDGCTVCELQTRLAAAERLLRELQAGQVGDQIIMNPAERIRAYFKQMSSRR